MRRMLGVRANPAKNPRHCARSGAVAAVVRGNAVRATGIGEEGGVQNAAVEDVVCPMCDGTGIQFMDENAVDTV